MRLAIFTVAVGHKWCQRAMALYDSLRHIGGYRGDFWIFTDRKPEVPHDENFFACTLHDAPKELAEIQIRRVTAAGYLVNVANYDAVLYLDADIIVINDIDGITWKVSAMPEDVVLVTPDAYGQTMGESDCHNGFLDRQERDTELLGINSGTWAGKKQAVTRLMSGWLQIFENEDYAITSSARTKEQAALNKWCLQNPDKWLWLSDPSTPVVVFGLSEEKPYSVLRHFMHTAIEHMPTVEY